jgi:hypothetical protein
MPPECRPADLPTTPAKGCRGGKTDPGTSSLGGAVRAMRRHPENAKARSRLLVCVDRPPRLDYARRACARAGAKGPLGADLRGCTHGQRHRGEARVATGLRSGVIPEHWPRRASTCLGASRAAANDLSRTRVALQQSTADGAARTFPRAAVRRRPPRRRTRSACRMRGKSRLTARRLATAHSPSLSSRRRDMHASRSRRESTRLQGSFRNTGPPPPIRCAGRQSVTRKMTVRVNRVPSIWTP